MRIIFRKYFKNKKPMPLLYRHGFSVDRNKLILNEFRMSNFPIYGHF